MENKLPDAIWLQAKDLAYAVKNDVPMRPVNMVAWVHPNAQMDTQYLLATPERLAALSSPEVNKEEDREGHAISRRELTLNERDKAYAEGDIAADKWLKENQDYFRKMNLKNIGHRLIQKGAFTAGYVAALSYKEEELRQDNEKMRQALLDIQKHCEINRTGMECLPAPYDKGIAWYIADKALNPQPSKESSNPTGGIPGTIEP